MRITVKDIAAKKNKEKISVLTSYSFNTAKLLDGEVEVLLVGDSLGMVLYGMESTLSVSLETMIAHGKAVVRGTSKSLVVVDMPFGTYQESTAQAFRNASKVLAETNCQAVKLEGGVEMAETAQFLTSRGIPVMGHIGLQPQSFNSLGGYKVQGKDVSSAKKLLADAKALEKAGCFAIVLEGIKKSVAEQITKAIKIPTIGIGASEKCDGQVLVLEDMLGLTEKAPKFVKIYDNLSKNVKAAVKKYNSEVKSKKFPAKENCYE